VLPRSKQAAVKWEDYYQLKKPKPTFDQIKSSLIDSNNNFAVIHGKASESYEIDIDGEGGKQYLEQVFPRFNSNLQCAIKNTMRVVTSNGQKIIFKYRPEEWPEGIDTIRGLWKGQGKHNRIDLQGNGSYSLGVGSVHPDGSVYSLAHGSEFNPLMLTKPEIEELVDIIAGDEYNGTSGSELLKSYYIAAADRSFNDKIKPLDPLDDETITTLAANAKKYYVDGSKNDFTLGLCGVLRKMGVSYDDVYKLEYRIDAGDSKNLNRVKYIFNHKGPLAGKRYLTKVLAAQCMNQFEIPYALDELFKPIEGLKDREPANQGKQNLIEEAGETITKTQRFLTIEESKDILYYNGNGVYVSGGNVLIEKEAERLYGYKLSNKVLYEIKGHIMRRTYHKHSEIDADINIINVKNGLYNIQTGKLMKHSPNYLSVNQKPIVYNPKAIPELFGKYLHDGLYPTEVRTAVECMAYTFYRDNIFETITDLFGYGSNGKSVLTSILTALHGEENVSNVPLSAMLKNQFALSDLEGKDVNIDSELSGATIYDTAVLKKLTGNQPIRIERKNQKAYDTKLYAKLWFSTNKIPQTADDSCIL
jgi:Family of unknown function (DUF5906)/D5 N terminal like/Bifunctional DNA primase/polymerase, N-terminal